MQHQQQCSLSLSLSSYDEKKRVEGECVKEEEEEDA
jgi:hypothetical protein